MQQSASAPRLPSAPAANAVSSQISCTVLGVTHGVADMAVISQADRRPGRPQVLSGPLCCHIGDTDAARPAGQPEARDACAPPAYEREPAGLSLTC